MNKYIYVVRGYQGKGEDQTVWDIGAYMTLDKAKTKAHTLIEESKAEHKQNPYKERIYYTYEMVPLYE